MFQEQSEKRAEMTSIVEELVGNQKIVQAFSYEERANERFGKVNEELRVCGIKAIFFSSITNPSTRFVNGLVYTAVGIFGAFECYFRRHVCRWTFLLFKLCKPVYEAV